MTYPVCVPSRFTLMTGEYAHTRLVPAIGWRMSPAERTIAHELGESGYQTAGRPGVDLAPRLRGGPAPSRDGVLLELVMDVRANTPYYEQTWRAWRTDR